MLPLWDANPHRRPPVMTATLIAANTAVFAYQVWLARAGCLEPFVLEHALVPRRLVAGWDDGAQWLTVFTHLFVHGGLAHVLGNCWFLWIFGRNVEDRLGPFRFLCLYLLAGAAAATLQVVITLDSPVPMIGASGAISGVLGAYLLLFPTAWIYTLVPWIVPIVPVPAFVFLILWFVIQAFNGLGALLGGRPAGGVAWWAHAGGFVAGLWLVRWAKNAGWVRRR
ncbi:MAG: rhomboid family intramembrane serine protease [Opitutaceae bacterium]|nr:rhomboid family intramembrane serine protease [Opitutaceae bacterium]